MISQFQLRPSLGVEDMFVECRWVENTFPMRVHGLTLKYMDDMIIAYDKGTDLMKKMNVKKIVSVLKHLDVHLIYTSLSSCSGFRDPVEKIVRNDFNKVRGPRCFAYVVEKRKIAAQHGNRKYPFSWSVCRL